MFSNEKSLALIADRFKQCVLEDAFVRDDDRPIGEFGSVREYIRTLCSFASDGRNASSNAGGVQGAFTDFSQTLEQLAGKAISNDTGDSVRIGSQLKSLFCDTAIRFFAEEVADPNAGPNEELWAELGATSWREWFVAVMKEDRSNAYSDLLYQQLIALKGDTVLLEFFVAPERLGNFPGWTDSAYFSPTKTIHSGSAYVGEHVVAWRVEASAPHIIQVNDVVGYEWLATLSTPDGVQACAHGTIYIFDRVDGQPQASKSGLMLAAGLVSDQDVKYVQVLIDQHADVGDLIGLGDLCIVQRWERKTGSAKKLGAQCLQVALNELHSKFKNLKVAVFDVRPSQFLSWVDVVEPPPVAVAKQAAIESLTEYIAGLDLPTWTVRNTFSNVRWNLLSAMMAIDEQAFKDGIPGVYNPFPDLDGHQEAGVVVDGLRREPLHFDEHYDELIDLFDGVGMGYLSTRMEDGFVTDAEIELALKSLIFGQRMHYLPVTASSGFDPGVLIAEWVMDQGEFDEEVIEFIDALPDEVEIGRVFFIPPDTDDNCPGDVIVEVSALTPYGTLYELYTLLPQPRPFNIVGWMSRTYDE